MNKDCKKCLNSIKRRIQKHKRSIKKEYEEGYHFFPGIIEEHKKDECEEIIKLIGDLIKCQKEK